MAWGPEGVDLEWGVEGLQEDLGAESMDTLCMISCWCMPQHRFYINCDPHT